MKALKAVSKEGLQADQSRIFYWGTLVLTALCPIVWGTTYIVSSEILPPDRPFTAALIRALPAGILLLMLRPFRIPRDDWGKLAILSILNIGLFQALLFVAAFRLPGGIASVVGATQPLVLMGIVCCFEQQRPRIRSLGAGFAAIGGMVLLAFRVAGELDSVGLLAAFAGTLSMALGVYLTHRWKLSVPLLAFTGWQLLIGSLFLAPFSLFLEPPLPTLSVSQVAGYVYLSLFGALIAYTLWFRGVKRLRPLAVSALGLLSPLTAVTLGWILLGQSLAARELLGFTIVLAAVLALQINQESMTKQRRS